MGICKIGIFGAGTVGGGVIQALLKRNDILQKRSGVELKLTKVAEPIRERALETGITEDILVNDYTQVTRANDVDVVVELIGGTTLAYQVVEDALLHGKAVVTANKALLAERGEPLFKLAQEKGLPIRFEASVAGAIPIILALREGLNANEFTSILGIVNGTCNYILTNMINQGREYADCLKEAQQLGFAEANPITDVGGYDSGHKLAILAEMAFDTKIDYSSMHISGIDNIDLQDVAFAQQLGYTIKLLAVARKKENTLFLSVHPSLLAKSHPLAAVSDSMNGIALMSDLAKESMFYGRGAGRYPTASAVLSDLVAQAKWGNKGCWYLPSVEVFQTGKMSDYETRFYLRFDVEDKPNVLAKIATELGQRGVSIASVQQHENANGCVPVIVTTHYAKEGDVKSALEAIEKMPATKGKPVLYRIEC